MKTSKNETAGDGRTGELMQRLSRDALSGGRRALMDGILNNLNEAVFLSTRELAKRFKTDPATVVRTVQALGYATFADFSKDLRGHFLGQANPYRVARADLSDHQDSDNHAQSSVARDARNLQDFQNSLDAAAITAIGKRLSRCAHVLVVADGIEHLLAEYLAYALSGLGITATAGHEGLTLQRVRALTAQDACIGITFRRCFRVPVEAVQAARELGAYTLAISDSATSPLVQRAEQSLLVPVGGVSFGTSFIAPLSLLSALLVTVGHANPKRSRKFIQMTEAEYGVSPRWYQERRSRSNGRASTSK